MTLAPAEPLVGLETAAANPTWSIHVGHGPRAALEDAEKKPSLPQW